MLTVEFYKTKLNLIEWINQLSDVDVLSYLVELSKSKTKNNWWNELTEDQKKSIEKGIEDADNGRIMSSEDFWKKVKHDVR